MASTAMLKCTTSHCSFETKDPNVLATHLQQGRADNFRWICLGDCGASFCATQVMDGAGGHHWTCKKFIKFYKERKYGRMMVTRLAEMSLRNLRQLDGLEPNVPLTGFSTKKYAGNSKSGSSAPKKKKAASKKAASKKAASKKAASKKATSTNGSRKANATPKPKPTPKRREAESDDEEDQSEDEVAESDDEYQPTKGATRKPSANLKRKAADLDESEDSGDEFQPKERANQTLKPAKIPKLHASLGGQDNNKRRVSSPRAAPQAQVQQEQVAQEEVDNDAAEDSQYEFEETDEAMVDWHDDFEMAPQAKLKHRFSATSSIEANTKPQAYGCTHCPITHLTLKDALDHAEQSNKDMRRWVCMGCETAVCHSEKHRMAAHIDVCPGLKNWMKAMNIAWPRRTDSDFLAMTDHSDERRSWPARNDARFVNQGQRTPEQQAAAATTMSKYAKPTVKKASGLQQSSMPAMAKPVTPRAVWYGSSWYAHESEGGVEHATRRPGVMYQPGTLTTIQTNAPPAARG